MTAFRLLYYTFPARLLALHLRNHLILVAVWGVLALMVLGYLGHFFGLHYLLLTPEYRGEVNFWSYFITGAAFGILFMIWHLTSYLLTSYRFPFLATLQAPFTKFCLNNSAVPLAFFCTYIAAAVWSQWHDELTSVGDIVLHIAGFVAGALSMAGVLAGYLFFTNKDIVAFLNKNTPLHLPGSPFWKRSQRPPSLRAIRSGSTVWRVDTYLTERLRLRRVRSVEHYDPQILGRVFRQNHANAVILQFMVFLLLMAQGFFMDSEWVRIPTGATLFILFGIVISLYGAIVFWFRRWSLPVFLIGALAVNFLTGRGFLNYNNRAYGLDYTPEKRAAYNQAVFDSLSSPARLAADKARMLPILDNWLARNRTPENPKPKLVFLCVSGGGLRSALWTLKTIQQTDRATDGDLLRRSLMISGASGGMLGAAYLREAYLRQQQGEAVSIYDTTLLDDMGKDLLNPVSFAIVSNDLFYPMTTFRSGNFSYRKDRGYLLERQLNANCRGFWDKRLADYRQPEYEARIPMMLLAPFILNDARRLLISPHGVSFMMKPPDDPSRSLMPETDGVDFRALCAGLEPDSLAFTTALRMNATYPFILPYAWLPTRPAVEVMDAGFRDNYGVASATRFVQVFADWIRENTGGVVLVQIRCWEKVDPIDPSDTKGVVENAISPAGALLGQITAMQDYEQDNALGLLRQVLGDTRLDVVRFIYHPVRKEYEASLSFHLSKREKLDVLQAFHQPENQAALAALKRVLQ